MDDQRFDDIIKNKVGEYTDPTFDAGAITGLHQHLAGYQIQPWYVQYKNTGLMAATLAVFTLINWFMIRNSGQGGDTYQARTVDNSEYAGLVADLRNEINKLQSVNPDTIYVINKQTPNPGVLTASAQPQVNPDQIINTFLLRLKEDDKIGKVGGYYFYHEDDIPSYGEFIALNNRKSDLDGSYLSLTYPQEDTLYKDGFVGVIEEEQSKMPIIVIRDLERHYSKGLGLKIGGEVEFAFSNPDIGTGEALPGVGLLAELVFSPSLALETGIKYKTRSYNLDAPTARTLSSYPEPGSLGNQIEEIETDSKLIEIPLNAKFYRAITQNKDFYLSLGVSPNLYLSQAFEYTQQSSDINISPDAKITSDVENKSSKMYLGTFNAGVGMAIGLPKQREAQVGLFYQKSLSGLGVEDRKMNIFGIKSSYWFRVR